MIFTILLTIELWDIKVEVRCKTGHEVRESRIGKSGEVIHIPGRLVDTSRWLVGADFHLMVRRGTV